MPVAADIFDRFDVVLVEPQKGVNVGSVVRAMKNMRLRNLHLLRPAEQIDLQRASISAHRCEDVIERIETHDRFVQCLENVHLTIAFTARARTFETVETVTHVQALEHVLPEVMAGARCALVFGREDCGLSNEIVDDFNLHEKRASFLSMLNQGSNLVEILFLFFASIVSTKNISTLFVVVACIFLISSFFSLCRKRNNPKHSA